MKSILRILAATVCIIVIAACASMIIQKVIGRARIDLTEHKMYTLSDGTHRTIKKLSQPVKLKLYYARAAALKGPEQIRYYNTYFIYVRDLLEEYVKVSKGRLSLEVIDPKKFTDEEDEAMRKGLKPIPITRTEKFFFGLVAQTELGKAASIPFFEYDRQEFAEYDISRLLVEATQREKKKVGVLSSLGVMGADMSPYMMQMMRMRGTPPPPPWLIVNKLREDYEVVSVKKDAEQIDEDIDFLIVIHPKAFPDPKALPQKTLFAIDQFVVKGGKLIVFVDPFALIDAPPRNPQNPMMPPPRHNASSNLNTLLEGWGVEMDPAAIAASRSLGRTISLGNRLAAIPMLLQLNKDCVSEKEVVVGNLHALRMVFPGVLRKVPGAEAEVVPLISIPAKDGSKWTPKSPQEMQTWYYQLDNIGEALEEATEPLMLACRITGKLKSNYPDGITIFDPVDAKDAKKDADGHEHDKDKDKKPEPKGRKLKAVKQATEDVSVLVFADVDMISNREAFQQGFFEMKASGDNAPMVLNALEFLGGTGDLIATRSRGRFQRPFTVVKDIEAEAEKATAKETAALRKKLEKFEKKLSELRDKAQKGDGKRLHSELMKEIRKLEDDKLAARKEQRALQADKEQDIENLKTSLLAHNLAWAPAFVLLIAIGLAIGRHIRARSYAARRTSK
jgi:gliding motility-associatede transport system auxiliary component